MLRVSAVGVLTAFLAACAWADDAQVQRQYTNRVLAMADTAAAHVELARWCQANGLADRARLHWQEAILRDSDCAEARAALGYVRRGGQWVQAPPAAPAPASPAASASPAGAGPAPVIATSGAPAAPAGPPSAPSPERIRTLASEIQDVFVQYLSSADPARRAEGRRRIMELRDPAAAEPLARILSLGGEENRRLACQALARIPGDEAARILVRFVLADESEEVWRAAVAALASRPDGERGLKQLCNALDGSERSLNRAAYALGEIGDLAAGPALIAHLRTPETRVLKAPAPAGGSGSSTGAYISVSNIVTYIADAEPVVAEAAVGWDLQIGAIPVGTTLSVKNPRVTIYRTIVEFVQRPAVRDALQKMVGEDHEYNPAEWRKALSRKAAEAAGQARPAHQP